MGKVVFLGTFIFLPFLRGSLNKKKRFNVEARETTNELDHSFFFFYFRRLSCSSIPVRFLDGGLGYRVRGFRLERGYQSLMGWMVGRQ